MGDVVVGQLVRLEPEAAFDVDTYCVRKIVRFIKQIHGVCAYSGKRSK